MAARDLVPALQAAVEGFSTVVDGKQPTLDAKLPTARTALKGARVSRDGALVARDATILSRDAAYRDLRSAQANLEHQNLAALAASKPVNAVDVFIYDSSKDSDGGAWRKRCAKTSWFNEPLNTATRGARREFPAVAAIVAEATKVTIYDGDDPTLPMWMVFSLGGNTNGLQPILGRSSNTIKCVAAKNGTLAVGCELLVGFAGGLRRVIFPSDDAFFHSSVGNETGHYAAGIAERNDISLYGFSGAQSAAPLIAGRTVNDVTMTVLPGAPVYPAAGLPVPTIAVATEGGVSVINNDGAVVDLTGTSPGCNTVVFDKDRLLVGDAFATRVFSGPLPEVDDTLTNWRTAQFARTELGGTDVFITSRAIDRFDKITARALAASNGERLIHLLDHPANAEKSAVAFTASDFGTGWLPGDIRGAFLADTDATDLVGGTDADRSVKNTPLTVNGTITRAPVATGAELVAYSGFSASNYLEQPYNPDLDLGTGDFCVMGWMDYDGGSMFCRVSADMELVFRISGGKLFANFGGGVISGATFLASSAWQHAALVRASGQLYLYLNARLDASPVAHILDLDDIDAVMRLGVNQDLTNFYGGSLALWRISATAPTPDQIRRIYQDEKVLFQENAACTLYGASDAVTALAHDPDTGLLHVGTSAGRSVFKGLRRVANTTQPVTTAISAANGMVIEQ